MCGKTIDQLLKRKCVKGIRQTLGIVIRDVLLFLDELFRKIDRKVHRGNYDKENA